MKAYPILSKIRGLSKEVSVLIPHLNRFTASEVAQERLRIITFYRQYGEEATKQAFGVDRKTIWIWQKRLKEKQGNLSALVPNSTRPHQVRQRQASRRVIAEIRRQRLIRPRLSKHKLKPGLDQWCRQTGSPVISEATIGRLISDHHLFFAAKKVSHNPASQTGKWVRSKQRQHTRFAPRPADLGYLQMDTVHRIVDDTRWYFYQAIDVHGKAALCLPYRKLSAKNSLNFLEKVSQFLPYPVRVVQTDNGAEFLGEFDQYLNQQRIPHVFIYPRCPRINGVVERFNRIVQEEFLKYHLDELYHPKTFYSALADYMVFYNCQRIHQSLHDMTPVNYLIAKGGMSKMSRSRTAPRKY